ncbi:MAG TPA: penicillin-binding protein 2 [Streptosporangiaceae bacterium]|nr:penicillin-binding protein 2 [Streptosporangiaceae bacterium]
MPTRRLQTGLWCAAFALSLVAVRLVQLQGVDGAKYLAMAQNYRLGTLPIPAVRGSITTADGLTLALTLPVDKVTADPPQITGSNARAAAALRQQVANLLSGPLGMPAATILADIDHPPPISPDYVVLDPQVSGTTGDHIQSLINNNRLPGIHLKPGYVRSYPGRDLASNLVGFTNTDSTTGDITGEAGIEQAYNRLLAGRDGKEEVETSISGQPLPMAAEKIKPRVQGGGVRLTIMSGIQWAAQQACADQVRATRADNCTAVVMQPATGKVLAMAQYPTYQPADVTNLAETTDLPVAAVFAPGSTAKIITAAAALEHGQTPATAYSVPEQIVVDGFPFHDAEYHPVERLTLAGIVAHSSNVGMVQVAEHVSPQVQYHYYRAFGIGTPAGAPLAGVSAGLLPPPSQWWGDQRYTLAFGQGVSVTALQMASVYATIANGGVRVPPTLVAGTVGPGGRFRATPRPHPYRVIKTSTARQLISILQQVPYFDATLANQPWGEIPGYSVAAKTGTAQEGRCQCWYGSSYIGMVPAGHPAVVVAVNVQNPRTADYYGNGVAGPVFYKVMKFALAALKIPPDHGKRPNVALTAP